MLLAWFLVGLAVIFLLAYVSGIWCPNGKCLWSGSSTAPKVQPTVDGSCGSADGTIVSTPPTGSALCATGSPTGLSGPGSQGIYSWSCLGTGGGASASCSTEGVTPPVPVGIPLTTFTPVDFPAGGPYYVTSPSGGATLAMNTSGALIFDTQLIGTAKNLLKAWNVLSSGSGGGYTISTLLGDAWTVDSTGVSVATAPTPGTVVSFGILGSPTSDTNVFALVPTSSSGYVVAIGIAGTGATATLAVVTSTSALGTIVPMSFRPLPAATGAVFNCSPAGSPPYSVVPGPACLPIYPPDSTFSVPEPSPSSPVYFQIWAGPVSGFFSAVPGGAPGGPTNTSMNMTAWPDLPPTVYMASWENFTSSGAPQNFTPTVLSAIASTPFIGGLAQYAFQTTVASQTYTLGVFVSDIESVLAGHSLPAPTGAGSTSSYGMMVWYAGNTAQLAAASRVIAPLMVVGPYDVAASPAPPLPVAGGSVRPSEFMTATYPPVPVMAYNYYSSGGSYCTVGITTNSPVPQAQVPISGTINTPFPYFVGFTSSPSRQTDPLNGPAVST